MDKGSSKGEWRRVGDSDVEEMIFSGKAVCRKIEDETKKGKRSSGGRKS